MLGTDIEFGLKDRVTGSQVVARAIINDNGNSQIGVDGHSDILELRPDPSKTPIGLARNLKKLFIKVSNDNPGIDLVAGPFSSILHPDPTGCHVHLSFKGMKVTFQPIKELKRLAGKYISDKHHTHQLYNDDARSLRLNMVLIGILCHNVEGPEGWLRRHHKTHANYGPYGSILDFRAKTYGLEYRSPSCLAESPSTFLSLMDISKAINRWCCMHTRKAVVYALDLVKHAKYIRGFTVYKKAEIPSVPETLQDLIKKPKLLDMANSGDEINFHVNVFKKWCISRKRPTRDSFSRLSNGIIRGRSPQMISHKKIVRGIRNV